MKEKGRRPQPDEPPSVKPGTRMLDLPPSFSDPLRLAEESVEKLKRRVRRDIAGTLQESPRRNRKVLPESED